jgi:hypothetical protein
MFYSGAPPINEFLRHLNFFNLALKMETVRVLWKVSNQNEELAYLSYAVIN